MEWMLEHSMLMLIIAGAVGFLMAWGVGANDVANAMGTSVGAGALTVGQAVMIAIVFEFAGAYLAGGEVTATVRKGIVDASVFSETPHYLVYGMLSALLAAGIEKVHLDTLADNHEAHRFWQHLGWADRRDEIVKFSRVLVEDANA